MISSMVATARTKRRLPGSGQPSGSLTALKMSLVRNWSATSEACAARPASPEMSVLNMVRQMMSIVTCSISSSMSTVSSVSQRASICSAACVILSPMLASRAR